MTSDVVFLLDVDNTLLDNDAIVADLRQHLEHAFSDGDVVFQPRRVQRSGLWDAVAGRVHIYVHKELMLAAVQRMYATRHYIMVDDKLRVIAAMKDVLRERLTTVFPRQGHYALDVANIAKYPAADMTVERIGDLADFDISTLPGVAPGAPTATQEQS